MRVLHVNTMDRQGGAARAAYRIHSAQRKIGVDSHLLALYQSEPEPFVHTVNDGTSKIGRRLRQIFSTRILERQITPTNSGLHSLNLFASGLADWLNDSDFDIINLHWIGSEMISVEEIARINKPIFWTMHDMWPLCGTEHYDDLEHPGRYIKGYDSNTRPPPYTGPDLDAWIWKRKKRAWSNRTIHLISPSKWLAQCAADSALMGGQPCTVIANCVNTDVFKPVDRRLARSILNLNPEKRYVLFGAASSTSDPRKGFHLLQTALKQLATREDIRTSTELLVFGSHGSLTSPDLGLPAHYLGNFNDEISLALLYSAADLFAAPSMQDNLPNTVVESVCCGTPCVAFSLGGMPDIIQRGNTGLLVQPFNTESFSNAIYQQLKNPMPQASVSEFAQKKFNPATIARSYASAYENTLRSTESHYLQAVSID